MRRGWTVLLAAVLLLGACGGDDSSGDSASSDAGEITTTTRDRAADRNHAQQAVLTGADLPGWEVTEPLDDEVGDQEFDEELAKCLGVPVAEIDSHDEPFVESSYTSPTGDQVSSEVTYFATAGEPKAELEELVDPKAPICLQRAMAKGLGVALAQPGTEGVQLGQVAVTPYALGSVGDGVVSYHLVVPLSGPGGSASLNMDVVNARQGRAGVAMSFMSQTPYDQKEEVRLTELVLSRLLDT